MLDTLKQYIDSKSEDVLHIKIRVLPKSPITEIIGQMDDGSWKIRVRAVPEKGRANNEIIRFFKKNLNLNEVEIVGGLKERIKLLRIKK